MERNTSRVIVRMNVMNMPRVSNQFFFCFLAFAVILAFVSANVFSIYQHFPAETHKINAGIQTERSIVSKLLSPCANCNADLSFGFDGFFYHFICFVAILNTNFQVSSKLAITYSISI